MSASILNASIGGLYLLQFDITAFNKQTNPRDVIMFGIGVAVFITAIIIVSKVKKRYNPPAMSGSGAGGRRFSSFALHREAKNLGLNRDQAHMLDFVFKHDNVVDPQRSLASSSLLDRHFLRAYRLIERTAGTDTEAQEKIALLFSTRNTLDAQTGAGSISSSHRIPENASAVLGTGRDNYPVKIISSKGENLVVENPLNALGTPIKLPRGSKITLSFFTKSSKGFSFESRIMGASDSANGPVLQIVHTTQIKNLSQRRFRRRQAFVPAYFYYVHMQETGRGKNNKKMIVDKRRLAGSIMDISIGGCSIKTKLSVPSGTMLKIEASPADGSNIAVLGQILRTNRSGISTIMHIKFLRVPRRSLNLINALVYEYAEE